MRPDHRYRLALRVAALGTGRPRGAALVLCMVILMVMTVLAVSTIRNVTLEERMAANAESRAMAFQAAEGGLRDAELWLDARRSEAVGTTGGASGVWKLDGPDPDPSTATVWWRESDSAWWAANGVSYGGEPTDRGAAGVSLYSALHSQPRYLIEYQAYVRDSLTMGNIIPTSGRTIYRITALGIGVDPEGHTRRMVQSTFRRAY